MKGKVYTFRNLLYWAEDGVICIEDKDAEGDFRAISCPEFFARVLVIKKGADDCYRNDFYRYKDERIEEFKFVEEACRCVKEARTQGDIMDPKVLENRIKHRRKSWSFDSTSGLFQESRAYSDSTGEIASWLGVPTMREIARGEKRVSAPTNVMGSER